MASPPPLMRLLVRLLADGDTREGILPDLREEFEEQVSSQGPKAARRWYRGQVLRSLVPLFWWRVSRKGAGWRRGLRGLAWSGPAQDAKYAVRSLVGAPGFSVVVILTLALGIGANTAVFSLVHSLILEPLPFPGGDRMVQLWRQDQTEGMRALIAPVPEMVSAWQEESGIFEEMGAYTEEEFHLTVGEGPVSVMGARISPEILSLISATPLVGRLFGPEDAVPDHVPVALLSEEIWTRRFGSDPGVVGSSIVVDGEPYIVVGVTGASTRGVLEAGFFGAQRKEILLALPSDASGAWPSAPNIVARLEPGLSVAVAQERLDVIQTRVAPLIDGHYDWFPLAISARDALAQDFRRGLWVVFGAVGIVLLIACANTATLLLVRRLARAEEIRVRLALGAGRFRLAGQFITESLILGGIGLILAVLMAGWLVDGAAWMVGGAVPEIRSARVDPESLAFALAVGLATTMAFGLIPLLGLTRIRPSGALARDRAKETRSPVGWTAHRSLVVGQVGLALVLVLGAGLLSNSLARLLSVDPGFETEGLAAAGLDLPRSRYDDAQGRIALFDQVTQRLDLRPGVEAAGWARFVPPRVAGAMGTINVEGRPPLDDERPEPHAGNWVAPEYFRAIGAPFLEGRAFTQAEISEDADVVVLNRSGAERYWPDGGAVGSRIQLVSDYGPSQWFTVVGIVPDVKAWWLGDLPERVQVYLPVSDVPPRSAVFLVRAGGDLGAVATMVQEEVQALDPALPVGQTFWVGDAFRQSVASQRFHALLLSSFGALGLLLAFLGVYGVLSLSVTRRTREIGVRLALGATQRDITRKVVGQGLKAVTLGSGLGLAVSLLSADVIADLLWGVEATDVATYAAGVGCVVLAGLLATFLSARRATGVDPVEALRRE